ncbi:MAG: C25 family cysteine peptidase [Caldisericia bacterium]|nr:C25 family cysteine peptidase [Caldisericia bacterium]
MLKNKFIIIILFLLLFLFLPKIILSKEYEKIYSFNENFEIILDKNIIVDINGDFEKDLTGFYYKNIKIFYEDFLEFVDFKIIYKNILEGDFKFNPQIKLGGETINIKEDFYSPSDNIIFYGNFKKGKDKFLLFKYYPFIFDNYTNVFRIIKNFDLKIKFRGVYYPLTNKKEYQQETYLIIGKNELKETLNFFIKKRSDEGYNVIFKPLEEFSVGDIRNNIRNYLKDNYRKLNIKYLLLIGGSSDIPYFRVYPYKNRFVLTDFFYGELTSDIDLDKDGKQGEPFEDKIDFYSEILVGRVPSNDKNFVKNVLERTLFFETLENKKSILLGGAIWNFETTIFPFTDGAQSLKIIFEETYNKKDFSSILLSEREGVKKSESSNIPLNYENFIIYQNEFKPGLILWQGHGYITSTFRKIWLEDSNKNGIYEENEGREIKFVDIDSINSFNKNYPSIVFMGSCDNMRGIENSLAYYFIKDYSVSVIAATDTAYYGIGWNGFNGGWLQSLMYTFSDYLKDGNSVSFSLSKAKELYFEKFISKAQVEESFANIYVFNIFGPPEISLKSENKIIKSNSAVLKENEIFKISFKVTQSIFNLKGLIEFDKDLIKLFKIESKNTFNYSIIDEGKLMFKIDKIIDNELFTLLFFGKNFGETKIILRGLVIDDKNFYDLMESERIVILKRNYIKYDLNEDGRVDGVDLIEFSKSFGSRFGDNDYIDFYDFTMDGRIDGLDLIEFSINFGKIY